MELEEAKKRILKVKNPDAFFKVFEDLAESQGLDLKKYCERLVKRFGTSPMEWENYGESSLTILSAIVGIKKQKPQIPYDPSDFRRCIHLLECLPDSMPDDLYLIKKTADMYPIWKPYYKCWEELCSLYQQEKNGSKAPLLYERLLEIRKNIDI